VTQDQYPPPTPVPCILLLAVVLAVTFLARDACAKCIKHTVLPRETLAMLAESYLGSAKHWREIKRNNHLRSNRIKAGTTLYIHIPDEEDFPIACRNIVLQRLRKLNKLQVDADDTAQAIINGIGLASIDISAKFGKTVSPRELLELCYAATTTAERESAYRFTVGAAGEIGMFQFKLRTVRNTLAFYLDVDAKTLSDKDLVLLLLQPEKAAYIFVLHFYELWEKCRKNMWCTWRRYNGSGPHAHEYAGKALQRHRKVYNIAPMPRCEAI
jgi:hypothetical protein